MNDSDNWSKYRSEWWTRYFTAELRHFWPPRLDESEPDAGGYRSISRNDVFDIGAGRFEHRELHTAVSAYVWGVGFNSRRSIRWLVRAFTTDPDAVQTNLRKAAAILAKDGAVAAYDAMLAGGAAWTKYMGPAYFTKYLFFTGYRDPGADLRPLILDKRVATALRERRVFGPRTGDTGWPGYLYRRYLEYCHEQNPGNPEAVEFDLFNEGRPPRRGA
ncbi:8-oxoguanine DNA glycosylase OGG fold protein [Mycobacteroides abscessus]|uniref:8-oxoguanine DNA glycosylase OGG fold protein n=1 Tax=Mycobacteroides abscessus TaxID=36809 RepID=UPI0009A5C3FC|nr:hypothetical protein [Mycobacteroides abscessus]